MNSEIKKMIKDIGKRGWVVTQGRKHYRANHPKGGLIFFSATPSCYHAIENIKAQIRKIENEHTVSKEQPDQQSQCKKIR